jgi:hypothetical protein
MLTQVTRFRPRFLCFQQNEPLRSRDVCGALGLENPVEQDSARGEKSWLPPCRLAKIIVIADFR